MQGLRRLRLMQDALGRPGNGDRASTRGDARAYQRFMSSVPHWGTNQHCCEPARQDSNARNTSCFAADVDPARGHARSGQRERFAAPLPLPGARPPYVRNQRRTGTYDGTS